jgi:thioredoxin-related protein
MALKNMLLVIFRKCILIYLIITAKRGIEMKKWMLLLTFICTAPVVGQEWRTNLDDAVKVASDKNRKILLFFSVADHCDTCETLERNVFETPEFASYAASQFELVKLDFSKVEMKATEEDFERNLLLIERYNKDGFFPLVVILNKDGRVAGKTGPYEGEGAVDYIRMLSSL